MTVKQKIYLSAPDVGPEEEALVIDALRSGWVAPIGPHVDLFEAEMAHRCSRAHAIALTSGTAALHLALLEMGAGPESCVVVPTMTFTATANAVVYTGATPVFVDCEPATGNIDPQLLDECLQVLRKEGALIAAVVPVDLLGRCVDYAAVLEVCRRHDVPVLADAAESLGSTYSGKPAGSFGEAAALSFNGNKVMTTSGGGMLLTDNPGFAERSRYLSTQARSPALHYEHEQIGYNYRLSNILAALGRAQLRRLDEMVARRRELRGVYASLVANVPGVSLFQREGDEGDNCWLTALLIDKARTGWTPADLSSHLTRRGIESRPLWKPMHAQPVHEKRRAFLSGASDALFSQGLALPSGSVLGAAHVERIAEALSDFVGGRP